MKREMNRVQPREREKEREREEHALIMFTYTWEKRVTERGWRRRGTARALLERKSNGAKSAFYTKVTKSHPLSRYIPCAITGNVQA